MENLYMMRIASGKLATVAAIFLICFRGLLGACAASTAEPDPDPENPPQTDPDGEPEPDPGQSQGGPYARAVSATLINVSWPPNPETDLAGYKVYRNSNPIPVALLRGNITTYADRNVLPATTYSYNLTAFDIAGNESTWTRTLKATTPPEVMPPLSFASAVFPILQSKCSSCHDAFLELASAYTRLTSMGSGACAGQRLTLPGNALRSLLFEIVTGSSDCAPPLPSGPLPSADANVIGAWINQGGVNN